jgi:glycosyltransferase involved in cell wall biosynthesis
MRSDRLLELAKLTWAISATTAKGYVGFIYLNTTPNRFRLTANVRQGLGTLTLGAQRHSSRFPRIIKSIGRLLLRRITQRECREIEDWTAPLIVRGQSTAHVTVGQNRPSELHIDVHAVDRSVQSAKSGAANAARLRCLVVTTVLDAGGLDEFVSFLARHLPLFEIDATVMCAAVSEGRRSKTGFLASELRKEGICVVEACPEDGGDWLVSNRPDVISAHDPPDWILQASSALQIPVVETLHEVPTPIGTDWKTEPRRSRYINTFVAVSELVRRQYLRGNPHFDAGRIVTIPNAFNKTHRPIVDRPNARQWLGLQNEFLFISLARQVLQKNGYGLVAAFADVAREYPDAHLLMAGRPDDSMYVEQIRRLRDSLPQRDQIHLRQNLPNPSTLLAAADCFVLNSFFEGWPLAPMEALCAGLPVIISDVGGAREQVGNDGSRGYVVPNPIGDPELASWKAAGRLRFEAQINKHALVNAMVSVIRNREHWAQVRPMLAAASKHRFNAEACAERHAHVLRDAVRSHDR